MRRWNALSRRAKIIIGVVAVLVVLVAIGSLAGTPAAPTGPVVTPAPANQPPAGTIWFGTAVDSSAMTMDTHGDSFPASATVGWLAIFSAAPNATTLTITIASVDSGGAETNVTTQDVAWSNPQANELAHAPDNALSALGAGTYTIRYVVNGTILAAGTVTVTP